MQWLKVQSSTVAEVSFEPDLQAIAVRYKDGQAYLRTGATLATFGELLAAPSKGKFLRALPNPTVKLQVPEAITVREPERRSAEDCQQSGGAVAGAASTLHVVEPDDCCSRTLEASLAAQPALLAWVCPKCGSQWWSELVGAVRHWRPQVDFLLVNGAGRGRVRQA